MVLSTFVNSNDSSTWRQIPWTLPAYCQFVALVMYYILKISVTTRLDLKLGNIWSELTISVIRRKVPERSRDD